MFPAPIRLIVILGIAVTTSASAIAQSATNPNSGPKNAEDVTQTLNQLLRQNQQLEIQNQQMEKQNQQLQRQNEALIEQIKALRGADQQISGNNQADQPMSAAVSAAGNGDKAAQSSRQQQSTQSSNDSQTAQSSNQNQAAQSSTQNQAAQSSNQSQDQADDKTKLPQASDGNPALFGEFNPGRGFTVGKSELGELNLSGYMAARYLNQLPASQTATDHLGRPIQVTPRQDFQFHRVMLFSQGWLLDPKFQYMTFLWTVQDTNQVAVGGALTYNFGKAMTLGMGWNAYPGTMSLQGSHPYWESYDRVMADEFFRPYFSQGLFAQGKILPKLEYRWMLGNNLSNLDVPAVKLNRDLSGGAALTWLPTTGEFGPRGAFGDYEGHQNLATRFNLAYTYSPEDRQSAIGTAANNTTLRFSDSLNVFDTGALAPGVTVTNVHYKLLTAAAGIKYHGLWIQGEGYGRLLDHFVANGPLPLREVKDYGFYVQAAYMIVPKRVELYGGTSYIFGQFGTPKEFLVGNNYYPWNTRNIRLNTQVIYADHSPVSSTFGFYTGQQTGPIVSIGVTALY
jgi:hypothetical protein